MAHDEIPDWVTGWNEYRRTRDEDAEEWRAVYGVGV